MFYKLKEKYLLRGWELLPHALVDSSTGIPVFIRPVEMDALSLRYGRIWRFHELKEPEITIPG